MNSEKTYWSSGTKVYIEDLFGDSLEILECTSSENIVQPDAMAERVALVLDACQNLTNSEIVKIGDIVAYIDKLESSIDQGSKGMAAAVEMMEKTRYSH